MQNPNEKSILVIGNALKVESNDIKNAFVKMFVDQKSPTRTEIFENEKIQLNYLNQTYSLTLSTTAGSEEYDAIRPIQYKNKDLIIVLFSFEEGNLVTEPLSWQAEVKHYEPNTPVIFVGVEGESFDPTYSPNKEPKGHTYIRIPTLDVDNANSVFCVVFERLFNIKVERPAPEKYTKESLTSLVVGPKRDSFLQLLPAQLYQSFLNYATSINHNYAELTMLGQILNTKTQPPQAVTVPNTTPSKETCLIN